MLFWIVTIILRNVYSFAFSFLPYHFSFPFFWKLHHFDSLETEFELELSSLRDLSLSPYPLHSSETLKPFTHHSSLLKTLKPFPSLFTLLETLTLTTNTSPLMKTLLRPLTESPQNLILPFTLLTKPSSSFLLFTVVTGLKEASLQWFQSFVVATTVGFTVSFQDNLVFEIYCWIAIIIVNIYLVNV